MNLISVIDGSTLNWDKQGILRDAMIEDLLFAKIAKPHMIALVFNDLFCDSMGDVKTKHVEIYPKFWNHRFYDKVNSEVTCDKDSKIVTGRPEEQKGGRGLEAI